MTITVKLHEAGRHGVIEHSDSVRWREGELAELRQQGGQTELHFRGGYTQVSAPQFSSGQDGGRQATFEVQGDLEGEESVPTVQPPGTRMTSDMTRPAFRSRQGVA